LPKDEETVAAVGFVTVVTVAKRESLAQRFLREEKVPHDYH
jgi:hypothetical protein